MKLLLLFVSILVWMSSVEASGHKISCPPGMKNIFDSPLSVCYALVDPSKGLLTYAQAEAECRAIYFWAHPVVMSRRSFLEDIVRFAIDEGIPTKGRAGFWLGFTRDIEAPLEANGTLSAANAAIRKDRSLYKYTPKNYGGRVKAST